ncbi:hypothetical protein RCL1_003914 [Eukaryota sp. TZLM3-RCL]
MLSTILIFTLYRSLAFIFHFFPHQTDNLDYIDYLKIILLCRQIPTYLNTITLSLFVTLFLMSFDFVRGANGSAVVCATGFSIFALILVSFYAAGIADKSDEEQEKIVNEHLAMQIVSFFLTVVASFLTIFLGIVSNLVFKSVSLLELPKNLKHRLSRFKFVLFLYFVVQLIRTLWVVSKSLNVNYLENLIENWYQTTEKRHYFLLFMTGFYFVLEIVPAFATLAHVSDLIPSKRRNIFDSLLRNQKY